MREHANTSSQDVVEQYQARGVDMNVVKGDSQNDRIYTAAPYGVEVSWLAMNQKVSQSHMYLP